MITAFYKCRNCGFHHQRNVNVDELNPQAMLNFIKGDTCVPCDCVKANPSLFPSDAVYPRQGNRLMGLADLVAIEHAS